LPQLTFLQHNIKQNTDGGDFNSWTENLNDDGMVTTQNVLIDLSEFGRLPSGASDGVTVFDREGLVAIMNLLAILGVFGLPC